MGSLELDLVTAAGRQNLYKVSTSLNRWVLYHATIPTSSEAFRVRMLNGSNHMAVRVIWHVSTELTFYQFGNHPERQRG